MDEQKIGDNYIVEEDKTNEEDIYQKNKVKNQEKMRFFKFLMYNTKVEIHLEELQSYLLWVSILENVVWLVCLALFISSPSTMKINWTFIYHVARAGVGIMLLFYIPKTFQVIENLQDFESNSLDDIQKGMETNYVSLLQQNEKVLKPLLMIYFILTVISVIIDIILFIVLCNNWSTTNYEYRNFVLLIAIVIFIVGDFVYLSFFRSLRYSFPPETLVPVKRAILGFFSGLKDGILTGFRGVVDRIRRSRGGNHARNAPE